MIDCFDAHFSKVVTFANVSEYKEHFGRLLFDDLRARMEGTIQDELRAGWARDMLPAEFIQDIGHDEYICCSFQILSNSDSWMRKVNTKMVVLIIFNLPDPDWKFKGFAELPQTHLLAIVDEQPTLRFLFRFCFLFFCQITMDFNELFV